jgi:hypothetical protein
MDSLLARTDAGVVALGLALAMGAAWGVGWWLGRRSRGRKGELPASKFDDASLALLGLLLAFTFSMAIGKHDQRRLLTVSDSNAIGDFYTCVSLLKEPIRTRLQSVIRQYTELRLQVAKSQMDAGAFENVLQQFQHMQAQMSDLVREAVNDGTPIAVPLTNTLNGVTSSHASRLAAARDRLPAIIVLLLFTSAVVATLLVGREQGAAGKTAVAGSLSFILLVTLAVYVTLDLNQPMRGLITISQEPFQRLLASMSN